MLPFYSSLPKGRIQDLAFDRDFYVPKARAPKRWMPSWFPSAVIVRALDILSTASKCSCLATDPTNFPLSFLLPIAEMGGSVARRHSYSERPRRLSATSASPRLACSMHGICDLQQLAQPQFCERLLMFTAPSE